MTSDRVGDMQDVELLDRFQNGDAEAFAMLLRRHQGPLYNFVLRSVRNAQVAEDLTQESFMRVINGAAQFNRASKFSTWLYTIGRNLCIDHARKQKHRRHASLDAETRDDGDGPGARLIERIAHAGPSVDRHAASEKIRERVTLAVESLPEDQREVFLMRHVQNLPFAEIAVICGVSENTIKSRMRYALERLQQALAEYEDYAQASG